MRIYTKHFKKGRQMKKKYIVIAAAITLLLAGCTNGTNNNNNQPTTKESQQTSQIETTTKDITTEETTTNTPEPTEAALAIREVLKNERPFIDTDNGYKETHRNDYSYFQGDNNANIGWAGFTMFDMENDGVTDAWVIIRNLKHYENKVDINDYTILIFRYYNEKVYGYQCNKFISLRDDEDFIWDSEYLFTETKDKYKGGGKIEFEGDKIKFIYYVCSEDKGAKAWLENLIPDENKEIIEDTEKCNAIIQKCEEKSKYEGGDSNSIEDVNKYIY